MIDYDLKYVKGGFFLSLVVIIWEASAVLIQKIFESKDTKFNKPLFLTIYNTCFFMIYLIPICWKYRGCIKDEYADYK
jgi:hypothetical protein